MVPWYQVPGTIIPVRFIHDPTVRYLVHSTCIGIIYQVYSIQIPSVPWYQVNYEYYLQGVNYIVNDFIRVNYFVNYLFAVC